MQGLSKFKCAYSVYTAYSQEVKITATSYEEGKFMVEYDLMDEQTDRKYTLRLYSSIDNYIQPMEQVSGDIGIDIVVGANKKLIWDARKELGANFSGQVALELKGQIYIPFISLEGFEDYGTLKRGRSYEITWAGGRGDNVLNFDLYNGEEKVYTIPGVANTGNYSLKVPTNIPPGDAYRLRVSDANNRDEVIFSEPFTVRRKIPLGIKIGAGILVGGLVGYLVTNGDPGNTVEPKIGNPPQPGR